MQLSELLEEKYDQYNRKEFIEGDPVCIPHMFSQSQNIEIAGFLAAALAWGQRNTIIRNAKDLISMMGNDPYYFLMHADENDLIDLGSFTHRTFNSIDAHYFIKALANIYRKYESMYQIFRKAYEREGSIEAGLKNFRELFFELPHLARTEKHIADIRKGAAAKRLNMFLRWMVRSDDRGVDFGIWKDIPASALYIPLDIHTGKVARGLGLLTRRQNDWKAVLELTGNLKRFDPNDPVKYDFALFGMGIFEGK